MKPLLHTLFYRQFLRAHTYKSEMSTKTTNTTSLRAESSSSLREQAALVTGMRVKESSKSNYLGKLNTIKIFLRAKGYGSLINGENHVIVPVTLDIIKELFGWLSESTDIPKKGMKKRTASDSDPHAAEQQGASCKPPSKK